jgi:hypothetical protein
MIIRLLGSCDAHAGSHNLTSSCVKWERNLDGGDEYTDKPTHLRVYRHETGDDWPWHLDGADNDGRYTEDLSRFATRDECFDAAPQFIRDNSHLTWEWDAARHNTSESRMFPETQPSAPDSNTEENNE